MAKKFRMPPPIISPSADDKRLEVSLGDDPQAIRSAIDKTGIVSLHIAVCEKLGSYVHRKAETSAQVEKMSDKAIEQLNSVFSLLTFLYVGRRLGTLTVKFDDDDINAERNDTGVAISAYLDLIAKTFGEKQATQIFRKLEKITDEVLQSRFGRSR